MSNSPNSGTNVGQSRSSSVGQTSAVQELGVGLSGGESEESGALELLIMIIMLLIIPGRDSPGEV